MRALCLVLAVLVLLSGCSTVPRAQNPQEIEKGKVFTVRIPREYNDEARTYAINQFVKSKGYDSYDAEMTTRRGNSNYSVYTITVPGSTPVKNLPTVRIANVGGTVWLLAIPLGIAGFVGILWLLVKMVTFGYGDLSDLQFN